MDRSLDEISGDRQVSPVKTRRLENVVSALQHNIVLTSLSSRETVAIEVDKAAETTAMISLVTV